MNWEGYEKWLPWPNLWHYPGISLEVLRKPTKIFNMKLYILIRYIF
jgi:hypothetical protein